MRRQRLLWIVLFFAITLALLPNFYRNRWGAVETGTYTEWQTRYDRYVVARLVKTRQDGFFSAGGLLGLGDTAEWSFDSRVHRQQYNTFVRNEKFESYIIYKSNPGLQGIIYGALDKALPVSGELKLKLFRGLTALASAMVLGLILVTTAFEFGLLAGLLALLFTMVSMWIVLPAGSIFWNYWGFYLPFLASGVLLAEAERKGVYRDFKVLVILYLAALAKTLVSGFDLTTTVLIMATVPFVYHAIAHRWVLKTFLLRFLKASLALVAGTLTGMLILLVQINAGEAGRGSAYEYILNRFTSHLGGNYDYFYETGGDRPIGVWEVLSKYLLMPAIDLRVQGGTIQILYWHLLLVFALFTLVFLLMHRGKNGRLEFSPRSLALLVTTWYSLLAPLSWYMLFRPHAFIHTHVNTMGWQMPFTLLGFALCGYVITELVLRLRRQGAQSTSQAL